MIYFHLGQYNTFKSFEEKIREDNKKSQTEELFFKTFLIGYSQRVVKKIECCLLIGQYIKALRINRNWLLYCQGDLESALDLLGSNYTCLMNFALIYKIIGFRQITKTLRYKILQNIAKKQIKASESFQFNLISELRVDVLSSDPTPFERTFFVLKCKRSDCPAKIYSSYQFDFNIWISWAELLLRQDKSIQRSLRCFWVYQLMGQPKWNIEPFIRYIEALLIFKEYQNARKMVIWMISIKKQIRLQDDYIVLKGVLFKVLMTCQHYKRAFKLTQNLIAQMKEITNCNSELVDFMNKCAELCYYHSLPKKVVQYCQTSRSLANSQSAVLQIQLLFSKNDILKGNFDHAKKNLENCLTEAESKNISTKQIHSYLTLICILTNKGTELADKHLSLIKPIQKPDLYRYYYRKSQLSFLKGTQKHLKSSLIDALYAKSIISPEIGTLVEPVKLELHIGTLYQFLKKPGQALIYFRSAVKLSIGCKGFYSAYTAYAFAKIGQTLSKMGLMFYSAVYCRIAYGIFRKLKLKQCATYRRSAAVVRSYLSLPFVPFEVPLKRYFLNIQLFLKGLTVEQHCQLYTLKYELSELFTGGKCDVQLAKCRIEMTMHLKMIGQYESATYLVGFVKHLLEKSSDRRIHKHMTSFKELLQMIT